MNRPTISIDRPSLPRRRGFTLIEVMTAVFIITLLVGISIYGFKHLNRTAKDNSTKATLQMLNGFLSELEANTARSNGAKGLTILSLGASCSIPVYIDITASPNYPKASGPPSKYKIPPGLDSIAEAGDVSTDGGTANYGRYGRAVQYTSYVMGRLMQMPTVKAAIAKLPDDRFLKDSKGVVYNAPGNLFGTTCSVGGPVILDGYGNPVLFIPAQGLAYADRGGQNGKTIGDQLDTSSNNTLYRGPLHARDGRPFWASAGVDGKFNLGDDNLYSFDQ